MSYRLLAAFAPWARGAGMLCGLAVLANAGVVLAQPAAGVVDAVPSASAASPVVAPSSTVAPPAVVSDAESLAAQIDALGVRQRAVRELLDGKLAIEVQPASLFEVELESESAIAVQVERLRGFLEGVDARLLHEKRLADLGVEEREGLAKAKEKGPAALKKAEQRFAKTREELKAAESALSYRGSPASVPPRLWEARIALDRARMEFLVLAKEKRGSLLADHQARASSERAKRKAALQAAGNKAKNAEAERDRALAAARAASDQTEKLIAGELGRLLEVKIGQAHLESEIVKADEAEKEAATSASRVDSDTVDLVERLQKGEATPVEADTRFDEMTRRLRTAFDEVRSAISQLPKPVTVPGPGADRLGEAGDPDQRKAVDELRGSLAKQQGVLARRTREQRAGRVARAQRRLTRLNHSRIGLYRYISSEKRDELTGVQGAAITEAKTEFEALTMQLRYDWAALRAWAERLISGRGDRYSAVVGNAGILKALALLVLLLWWRRRGGAMVDRLALQEEAGSPTMLARLMVSYRPARGPIEWLLFSHAAVRVLPGDIANSLEGQAIWLGVRWVLGGLAAVHVVNGWARRRRRAASGGLGALRLRTLELLGWVVIAVGSSQALAQLLLGAGTVHAWVEGVSWLLLLPVGLLIISWWRSTVYERLESRKGGNNVARWVSARKGTISSFPAAAVGAVYLLLTGGLRLAKSYLGEFDLTRRILAYMFRREINRQAKHRTDEELQPLPENVQESLDPRAPGEMVTTPAGWELGKIIARFDAGESGLVALVGERGIGKSTLLGEMAQAREQEAIVVQCPRDGLDALRQELRQRFELDDDANDLKIARAIAASGIKYFFLDDAHRVVHPSVGGFSEFDSLLALARASSRGTSWVFGIDSTTWHLIDRARFARPVFDEIVVVDPWTEEAITSLLETRTDRAEVKPSFDRLLPPGIVDDIEKEEALERTQTGYYRLLWDYALGNPAVALHFWRESLACDEDGGVHIRLFAAPETADLERLPDPAVFVLRALVQLQPAKLEDLVAGTRLPAKQVKDAIRYARTRGYIDRTDQRIALRWHWYRAVTRFLQRRHLLPGEASS